MIRPTGGWARGCGARPRVDFFHAKVAKEDLESGG